MSTATKTNFFDQWSVYAKVVAADYMFHREIGAAVEAALRARFAGRAFSLLDLGCGDAKTLAPLLARLRPSRYVGVDMTQAALDLAARNLSALACPVDLRRADLLDGFGTEKFDAIHASFSLHHLPTERKAEFFRRAAAALAPGGMVLLVDVMREEDEALDLYHRRYCDALRATWTSLAPSERDEICAHIAANDFPEPHSALLAQARAAGLFPTGAGAKFGWHRFVAFAGGAPNSGGEGGGG